MKNGDYLFPLIILVTMVVVTSSSEAVIPQSNLNVPAETPYPTPLTQWLEFPEISVTRFDLGNVSVHHLLEVVAASTVFNDITWDSTLDSCPTPPAPVRRSRKQKKVKQDFKRKRFVLETHQDGEQASPPFPCCFFILISSVFLVEGKHCPKELFKAREPASNRPPRVNSDLQTVWNEALNTKVQNRVKREALFPPRNFFPNNRNNGTRDRNFWRVNNLPFDDHLHYPFSTIVRVETIDSRGNVATCTGTVVGVSTVLTAPECVYGTQEPPLILTGYKDNTFSHAFLTDELWIPSNYNPCTFYSDGWAQFPQTGSDYFVPVPSKGSFALLHIARNALLKKSSLWR